jgi:hypothetical protein
LFKGWTPGARQPAFCDSDSSDATARLEGLLPLMVKQHKELRAADGDERKRLLDAKRASVRSKRLCSSSSGTATSAPTAPTIDRDNDGGASKPSPPTPRPTTTHAHTPHTDDIFPYAAAARPR